MHIGVLTGGGDCSGLNALLRGLVLNLVEGHGLRVSGVRQGFLGLLEDRVEPLSPERVRGQLLEGGSLLGCHNKANPFAYFGADGADCSERALACAQRHGLDALVVVGGDGTMGIAERIHRLGLPVLGLPKTIDNDLMHNERSLGFDSAVEVVSQALRRLKTTAASHGRVLLLEAMGRTAGWLALEGGLAGGADLILLPELGFDEAELLQRCQALLARQGHAVVCVAEGAASVDALRPRLQAGLGEDVELRTLVLGHLQRGGEPTPFDRVLGSRLGVMGAEAVVARRFGQLLSWQGQGCVFRPLADVVGQPRLVPPGHELVRTAQGLGAILARG